MNAKRYKINILKKSVLSDLIKKIVSGLKLLQMAVLDRQQQRH